MFGDTVSVPQAAPLAAAEASQPSPAAPATASHDVVAEAQAFLDRAFSGGIPTEDDDAPTIPLDEAAAPDAGQATPATPAEPSAAEDAAAEEQQPAEQPEKPSRRQREQAARAKPEQQPPAPENAPQQAPTTPSREEIIAEWQREQEAKQEAERAQQERASRFGRFTGDAPADPTDPNSPTLYQQLQATAYQTIPTLGYDADQQAFDARERVIAERNRAQAQLAELDLRREMLNALAEPAQRTARQQALDWTGRQIEAGVAALGIDVQRVIAAGAGKPEPLAPMVQAVGAEVRRAVEAELNPRIAELSEERDALQSEVAELRRQLGGRAPQVVRGGAPAATARVSIEALDALRPTSADDLSAYLDLLPPAPGRRR